MKSQRSVLPGNGCIGGGEKNAFRRKIDYAESHIGTERQ